MPHYTDKTGELLPLPPLAPKLLGRHSADQTGKHQESYGISSTTPRINQHNPLARLNHSPNWQKKKKKTEQ
jgi:hypothetical protein